MYSALTQCQGGETQGVGEGQAGLLTTAGTTVSLIKGDGVRLVTAPGADDSYYANQANGVGCADAGNCVSIIWNGWRGGRPV